MNREQFEELVAGFLLDELEADEHQRLKEAVHSSEEFRQIFESTLALDSLLGEALTPLPARQIRKKGFRGIKYSLVAAMTVAVAVPILVRTALLSPPPAPLFVSGKGSCRYIEESGFIIAENESLCDYSLPASGKILLRIFPGTRIQFTAQDPMTTVLFLEQGSILIDSKRKDGESLFLTIGTNQFRFLGTRVAATAGENNDQRLTVIEGSVAVRSETKKSFVVEQGREFVKKGDREELAPASPTRIAWAQDQFVRISKQDVSGPDEMKEIELDQKTTKQNRQIPDENPPGEGPEKPVKKQTVISGEGSESAAEVSTKEPEVEEESSLLWRAITYPGRIVRKASEYSQKKWTGVRKKIMSGTGEARREVKEIEEDATRIINDIKDTFQKDTEEKKENE